MNIIVNGGSRGIGKEVVLLLAKDSDNKIIATGRNRKALDIISASSANIHAVEVDLSSLTCNGTIFRDEITGHFKRIDILINMAGMLISKEFMLTGYDEGRVIMETNFFGPAAVIRLLQPLMQDGAHILNISSMGGYQGSAKFRGLSYYSASKAAIACLSECLAEEFKSSGISVNCLALGAVQTEMLQEAFPGLKAAVGAGEIAQFISYFAMNGHKFMNGKIIPVALNNP
jgi:3-oxoacyl-[acyl-carrier protein] reductase